MRYCICDETDGRLVNESEAYGETGEYGNFNDPCRYHGDLNEAKEISERLREGTGHRFTIRMWPQ